MTDLRGASQGPPFFIIRPEREDDYGPVGAVVAAAFGRPNEARLVELIRSSENYVRRLSLVAEEGDSVVGHAVFSYVGLEGAEVLRVLCLAPVSVVPSRQRRGIGSALVRAGIQGARRLREPLIVVLGHPGYYPRFGFEPAARYGIHPPSPGIPSDAFMVLPLAGWSRRYTGRIVYPPAFDVT